MTRGRFITLEGGDGAGKSTQIARLCAALEARRIPVLRTREVGGCESAEEIRALWLSKPKGHWDPMSEVLLIMAARQEHLIRTILPALKAGKWVVSDRFVDSTRVYQGVGLGLGVDRIDAVYACVSSAIWPDLTLYLDLPAQAGARRLKSREGPDDRYQQEKVDFHERLREGFLALAKREPTRIRTIDAAPNEDCVAAAIWREVEGRLLSDEK